MPRLVIVGLLAWTLGLLAACSGDPGTGPLEVKWDRYTCDRCRMVLSDRQHAAQVRLPAKEQRSRVHFFDDLGCALIWLEEQPGRDDPGLEMWVTDWRDGAWIDARSARYLAGQITPMGYGLGAQADPNPDAIDFEAARESILAGESGNHHHLHH